VVGREASVLSYQWAGEWVLGRVEKKIFAIVFSRKLRFFQKAHEKLQNNNIFRKNFKENENFCQNFLKKKMLTF
jgi:hypothetical protein